MATNPGQRWLLTPGKWTHRLRPRLARVSLEEVVGVFAGGAGCRQRRRSQCLIDRRAMCKLRGLPVMGRGLEGSGRRDEV